MDESGIIHHDIQTRKFLVDVQANVKVIDFEIVLFETCEYQSHDLRALIIRIEQ